MPQCLHGYDPSLDKLRAPCSKCPQSVEERRKYAQRMQRFNEEEMRKEQKRLQPIIVPTVERKAVQDRVERLVVDQPPPKKEAADLPVLWGLVLEDAKVSRTPHSLLRETHGAEEIDVMRSLYTHLFFWIRQEAHRLGVDAVAEMLERDRIGRERYGTPLQPLNGRDPRVDLLQELLDALVYTRQSIWEEEEAPFSCLILMTNEERDQVLLCQGPHKWALPGGKREPGERPMACALREFKEEAGVATSLDSNLKPFIVKTHDGKPMWVYERVAHDAMDRSWVAPEGECRFFSIKEAVKVYREDWRGAFINLLKKAGLK